MWVFNACGQGVLDYNNGTAAFTVGRTLTGQTSNATGVIKAKTGTAAAGTLTLWQVSGIFQNGEIIKDNKASNPGIAQVNGAPAMTVSPECCFQMGGCGDPMRPYPPPRQASPRAERDPSLAYDLSDYGHLGYDPALGAPNPNAPVQNQYTGTWAMYKPASARPEVGQMLAHHILGEFTCLSTTTTTTIVSTTTTTMPPTLISLDEFKAIAGNRKVTILWTTASETDNAGFNIYRGTEENGVYTKINAELIPANGSPSTSATYQFIDKPVKNRTTYWYKLEDIDLKGEATVYGPVSAKPGFFGIFSKKK